MQDKDPIEKHFSRAFADFRQDPPENSWREIRKRLRTVHSGKVKFPVLPNRLNRMKIKPDLLALAGTPVVIVLIVIIWFAYSHNHTISGHAYAGEFRLSKGFALLYQVYDKAEPVDTVKLVQSTTIDVHGFYEFRRITDGSYIIKVVPARGSETMKSYLPSFYDQNPFKARAYIIRIKTEDPVIDVHLIHR